MPPAYERVALADLEPNPAKPSDRWEVSRALDLAGYHLNVAVVAPGERLSRTAYHRHPDQEECYYIVDGVGRVEVEDGSFDLGPEEACVFRPAAPHLLHNPYDAPVTLLALGAPPEAHHPVEQVQTFEALLAERYPGGDVADGADRDGGGGDAPPGDEPGEAA